jgi:hypothetical protein
MTSDPSALVLFFPLWIGVCWWLLLTILPTTRRLARLRSAHLLRALVLQAGVLILAGTALRVMYAASENFWLDFTETVTLWVVLGLFVWSVAWWTFALRVGWGIRSWLLIVLGHVITLLSMFVVGELIVIVDGVVNP